MHTVHRAPAQETVLEAVKQAERPIQPKEIEERTGLTRDSVNAALRKLKKQGKLAQPDYGLYDLPGNVEEEEEEKQQTLAVAEHENGDEIPFFDAGAGTGKENGHRTITVGRSQLRSAIGYAPAPERIFAVRAVGHSMEPWIRDRQIVICEEVRAVGAPGRYVYWLDSDEGYVIKDIEPAGDGALRITQHGPNPRTEVFEPIKDADAHMYRDESGRSHFIDVRGRVIYPEDTARAILTRITDELRKVMGR